MSSNLRIMKTNFSYDLLIIGGGISACVFASKYLQNNITEKVALIEVGRGLGGRSSTRISNRFKGWKLNHGAPNFNISKGKDKLLKNYINELLENKFIKIDDSEFISLGEEPNLETIKKSDAIVLLTEWEEFQYFDYKNIFSLMRSPSWFFDARGIIDSDKIKSYGFKFWRIGLGS